VATKQVNIDILAKDKTQKAMQSATKGVNKLKDNVQQSVAHQQKSFNALGNTVRNVIGGVIVFQALRFSKQMVDMASSVEEMQSKSSVVFGRFVSEVRVQLEKFGDTVGRSTFELEQMASSIQDTFVPMGFARKEASQLSVQLTKLAVDVASFNNASDVETMMAFQSALVGNHETVRRFGVVITEATLKQELLRMGITKTADEITNAEKVQARLNLIIAGTADAQGDAERTNTSFANSMKALSAEFQEFMVEAINPMLPALSKMVQSLKNSIIETKEFLRSIGLLDELNKVIPIVDHLKENSDALAKAEAQLAFEEEKLNAVRKNSLNPFKLLSKENEKYGFGILSGENAIQKNITALKEQIETIKSSRETIVLESEARDLQTKFIDKQTEAIKKQNKAKKAGLDIAQPIQRPDFIGMGDFMGSRDQMLTPSMTGSELLGGASPQIVALQDMADMELQIAKSTADEKLSILNSFNQGFMASLDKQKDAFTQIEDIGKASFGKLKSTLTDFVMTGKLNFADLGKFVVRSFVEMLVGEAVKMAFSKSMAMFKMDAIKKAMISLYEGAMKTFASIPFPFNIVAVGGALAFGASLINKIKGFEKGGRPPVGQPSIVGEKGAELFVPDQAGTIVPNDKLGMGKQVTVNFNISTVDARGFNELLVNSRGTIVNMINNAVNEKGRVAII
jgi:hypothetical protein